MEIAAAVIPREWGQRLRYIRGNGDICLPNDSRSQARVEPNVNLLLDKWALKKYSLVSPVL